MIWTSTVYPLKVITPLHLLVHKVPEKCTRVFGYNSPAIYFLQLDGTQNESRDKSEHPYGPTSCKACSPAATTISKQSMCLAPLPPLVSSGQQGTLGKCC